MDGLFRRFQPDDLPLADKARLGIMPNLLPIHILAEAWALEKSDWDAEKAEPLIAPIMQALASAIKQGCLAAKSVEYDSDGDMVLPRRAYNDPAINAQNAAAFSSRDGAVFLTSSDEKSGWIWQTSPLTDQPPPIIYKAAFRKLLIVCGDPFPKFWFSAEERAERKASLAGLASQGLNRKAKELAITLAKEKWEAECDKGETITRIGDMAKDVAQQINIGLQEFNPAKPYTVTTIREWIKPHAPLTDFPFKWKQLLWFNSLKKVEK